MRADAPSELRAPAGAAVRMRAASWARELGVGGRHTRERSLRANQLGTGHRRSRALASRGYETGLDFLDESPGFF